MFGTTSFPAASKTIPASGSSSSSSSSAGVASNNSSRPNHPASIDGEVSCSSRTAVSSSEALSLIETHLPNELLLLIASYLPNKLTASNPILSPLQSFAGTCNRFFGIATGEATATARATDADAPELNPLTSKFLEYLRNGEQNKVSEFLALCPEVLLKRGTVTDYAGRTFTNIFPLQFVAWSWDMPMWMTMLNGLPKTEQGEEIRKALVKQCGELDTQGVDYSLEGNPYRNSHFDFSRLISAYQGYLALFNAQPQDWDAIDKHWCTVVGMAQRYIPVELRQRFCGREPFYPTPAFTDTNFVRSLKVYNWLTGRFVIWDNCVADLGVNFGVWRSAGGLAMHGALVARVGRPTAGRWGLRGYSRARDDLAAVTAYCKERTENYAKLKELLQNPIQIAVEASSEVVQEGWRCVIS